MAETSGDIVDIREALPADVPALLRAIAQINEETDYLGMPGEVLPWTDRPADFVQKLHEQGGGVYLVAVSGGAVVGYLGAFVGDFARTRGVVFVAHVGVRQALRGCGIGRQLLMAVEAWARDRHAHRLELRVDEANQRGLALYRGRDFSCEGQVADAAMVDGSWHTHYWMAKPLVEIALPEWAPAPATASLSVSKPVTITTRAALPGDAAVLCHWERKLLGDGAKFWLKQPDEVASEVDMAKHIAEALKAPGRLMQVATMMVAGRERIVGRLDGWRLSGQRAGHDGHFRLNVSPQYWQHGVGRSLAEELAAWAGGLGLRRLSTILLAHNVRGRRFAEAQGFVCEVVSPGYAVIDGRSVRLLRFGRLLR